MRLLENIKHAIARPKQHKTTGKLSNRTAIGIDMNQHSIKMVQLSGRSLNQIQLEKYVITKLPKNVIKGNRILDYDQLVTYLQQSYAQMNTSGRNFVAAIPQSLANMETFIYNPSETDLDLEEFAQFQLEQLGISDNINFDYQVTCPSAQPEGQQIVLVTCKESDVDFRSEMFSDAGLELSAMDLDLLAQRNAYTFWTQQYAPELVDEKIAVFGIYSTQMYALVMQNGQILYRQETPVSAEQLNQMVQRTYQVNEAEADRILISPDKPEDFQTQIADLFNIQVAQEIQRVLQFYYTTQSTEVFSPVRHILLTGTSSRQLGLADNVFELTHTATQCIHPATWVKSSNAIDVSQLNIDAPSLTLAFALALRGL